MVTHSHLVSYTFGTSRPVSHANIGTQCHAVSHAFGTENISVLSPVNLHLNSGVPATNKPPTLFPFLPSVPFLIRSMQLQPFVLGFIGAEFNMSVCNQEIDLSVHSFRQKRFNFVARAVLGILI